MASYDSAALKGIKLFILTHSLHQMFDNENCTSVCLSSSTLENVWLRQLNPLNTGYLHHFGHIVYIGIGKLLSPMGWISSADY